MRQNGWEKGERALMRKFFARAVLMVMFMMVGAPANDCC